MQLQNQLMVLLIALSVSNSSLGPSRRKQTGGVGWYSGSSISTVFWSIVNGGAPRYQEGGTDREARNQPFGWCLFLLTPLL